MSHLLYGGNSVWEVILNDTGTERRLIQRSAGNNTWDTTQKTVPESTTNTTSDTSSHTLLVDEYSSDGTYMARIKYTDEQPFAGYVRKMREVLASLC